MPTQKPSSVSAQQQSRTSSGSEGRSRFRPTATLVAVAAALGALWVLAAWRAGTFLGSRDGFAISMDDPDIEAFSQRKRLIDVGPWRVAYVDEGGGEPVFLLHGCPFHSYEWRQVIPGLSKEYRVIAPDLLGLGDTQVRLSDDYRLPNDVRMVVGLMDALGIQEANFVGHDHGAATLQLMMRDHPERIRRAVLTNAEAYDQWPSKAERPEVELVVNPVLGPLFRLALKFPFVRRQVFSIAVYRKEAFSDEVLAAYTRALSSTPARWQRLQRFFRWQLDRDHNLETLRALDGMRQFKKPTLILWGRRDTNFGPLIAERLAGDIPGTVGIKWMEDSAHMPMQEQPEAYTETLLSFFAGKLDVGNSLDRPGGDG